VWPRCSRLRKAARSSASASKSAENKGTSGGSATSRVACKRWWTNHARRTATPHAVSADVVPLMVTARRKHPRWCPRKLLVVVRRQHPEAELPAASAVGTILKKYGWLVDCAGCVEAPLQGRLAPYDAANRVWCADFKGNFAVAGERCNPLTVSDGFSRYLLTCKALRSLEASSPRVLAA
jgi:hypothetical protein